MKLTSKSFKEGDMIPPKYTADGQDINPHLAWTDAPGDAKSFAVIVDDPDAPVGLWTHWLVSDIPPNVREIQENSFPAQSVLVENDFHRKEWGGPSPPSGVHRYFFKVYALKVPKLLVKTKKEFYAAVEKNKIEMAQLMGKYTRQKKK